LTELSVWLLTLGLRVEIIAPGKPQQNGRLERLHRTLKAETTSPPGDDCRVQQRIFDLWRREYNHDRPHEALKLRRPANVYRSSSRKYPRPLIQLQHAPFCEIARVDKHGFIKWHQRNVFISSALKHEYIQLNVGDNGLWDVQWGAIALGSLDEHHIEQGLIVSRPPRGSKTVTTMSLLAE
jgi:putative transposase